MNMIRNARERMGNAFGSVIAGFVFFLCGGFMAFFISPQQAGEWRRIDRLPEFTPELITAAEMGDDVVFTGTLEGNETTDYGLVLYEVERWVVNPPSDSDDDPSGNWVMQEEYMPSLRFSFMGAEVRTTPNENVYLGGDMFENITDGPSTGMSDDYNGQTLHEDAARITGFKDGDLVTVYGEKASTGDIVPKRYFGGDRVQLVENIKSGARFAFIAGIVMMAIAPFVALLSVFQSLFGRKKKPKFG